jgi:carbonic anhydrase
MRLLDAILEANQRKLAGDAKASVATADFPAALPIAALSCIDARLNRHLPVMLGVAEEQFVWLRNAGNIITSPLSSTTRSLALACAVKGAKEIVIIGHSDCQVCETTVMQLLERMAALGVDRHRLPDNLVEYFGLFGSERQNVIRAVEIVRSSPLIGSKVPVHGLLIDIATGKLESVVNGYETKDPVMSGKLGEALEKAEEAMNAFARIGTATADQMHLPSGKIGDTLSVANEWLRKTEKIAAVIAPKVESAVKTAVPEVRPATPPASQANPLPALQERMRQYSANRPKPVRPKK